MTSYLIFKTVSNPWHQTYINSQRLCRFQWFLNYFVFLYCPNNFMFFFSTQFYSFFSNYSKRIASTRTSPHKGLTFAGFVKIGFEDGVILSLWNCDQIVTQADNCRLLSYLLLCTIMSDDYFSQACDELSSKTEWNKL